jgi:phosphonate transport system substrate-binding protein
MKSFKTYPYNEENIVCKHVRRNVMKFLIPLLLCLVFSQVSYAMELTIGLIPEQNVFKQMKRYEPMGEYIEEKTGMKVSFIILSRYGNIIERFSEEKMDGAFWGSFTGALAIKQLGIQPIARPQWSDGTSTYHGYIFVRRGGGIKGISDMKGKKIAFVEKATTAGYVFPLAYLRSYGVTDIEAFFAEHYYAGSHDAAVNAVLDEKVDIGCSKNTIFNLMAEKNNRVSSEIEILAQSPDVPSNGFAVRKGLAPETIRQLKEVLLGMHEDPKGKETLNVFGAAKFIETSAADYGPVFDLTEKAGIDLETYQYYNE